MGLQFDIAIRSTHKYAMSASGDTTRIVDLPDGGVALLVIDGQGSGPSARAVAREVAAKLTGLLQDGAEAVTAARAASETLRAARSGQVSVSFDIVRAGQDRLVEIARLSTNVLLVREEERWRELGGQSEPAGRGGGSRPFTWLLDANSNPAILIATDGVARADKQDDCEGWLLGALAASPSEAAAELADAVFREAMERVDGRPADDMTVAVLLTRPAASDQRIERNDYLRVVR